MKVIQCLNPKCERVSTDGGNVWKKDIVCRLVDIDYDICAFCKKEDDDRMVAKLEWLNVSYLLKMFWWRK